MHERKMRGRFRRWTAVALGLGLLAAAGPAAAGPAAAGDPFEDLDRGFETRQPWIADPLEPWNRLMFKVNDSLYTHLLRPAARSYKVVMPEPARLGVRNFFTNLGAPSRFVACLLQGKGRRAGHELTACVINSTFGLFGFLTPAHREPALANIPAEDQGQSLAVWGLGHGPYLVWPFMGPSSLRDSAGLVLDRLLNPFTHIEPQAAGLIAAGVDKVNAVSLSQGEYEALRKEAVAPYEALRDIYVQHRRNSVEQ